MPLFIDPNQLVPVTLGEDTIWVLSKMSLDVDTAVTVEFNRINQGTRSLKAYDTALLKHNIKKWEGPGFTHVVKQGKGEKEETIPCTPKNIGLLDPLNPIIKLVLAKIDELNKPPVAQVTPQEAEADPNLRGDGI